PPRATLFPYTTLFRSLHVRDSRELRLRFGFGIPHDRISGDSEDHRPETELLAARTHVDDLLADAFGRVAVHDVGIARFRDQVFRSEEHTSELQSRFDL